MEEPDLGVHLHCTSCFYISCDYQHCPVTPCSNGCGTSYHLCKETDHLEEICSEQEVSCINKPFGCSERMLRRDLSSHISSCPASIVICCHTWNRWPLSSSAHHHRQHFNRGQLDYELVLRDQRMQRQLSEIPRKVKVQLRNFLTKKYPEVPVPSFTNYSFPDDKSVPDKTYITDIEGNVIVDLVMKQYMKQQLDREKAWKKDLQFDFLSLQTEATKLRREGIHNHCRACVLTDCSVGKMFDPARWRESCPTVECRWGCGAFYHHCKAQDHSALCRGYREPDSLDWIRRLRIESEEESQEEEVEVEAVPVQHTVRVTGRAGGVPEMVGTLTEPTHLNCNLETVHRMQVKPLDIRSFVCGKVFRRDEIHQHISNIHQEIIPGLGSGWFLSRCPLAYLGCPFAIDQLAPNGSGFRLVFSREDDNFCCRLTETEQRHQPSQRKKAGQRLLPSLPVEILFHICSYLDPISLRGLSMTSKQLRTICLSLVRWRGCVSPVWERQRARGQRRERLGWVEVTNKWFFSTSMARVERWVNINSAAMQEHLAICSFNEKNSPRQYELNSHSRNQPLIVELKHKLGSRSNKY